MCIRLFRHPALSGKEVAPDQRFRRRPLNPISPATSAGCSLRRRRSALAKLSTDFGVPALRVDRHLAVKLGDRQPGAPSPEARIHACRLPRHRRAAAVAALGQRVIEAPDRIFHAVERNVGLGKAELLALEQEHCPFQREQKREAELGERIVAALERLPGLPARNDAQEIMVGKRDAREKARPAVPALISGANRARRQRRAFEKIEGIDGIEAFAPI